MSTVNVRQLSRETKSVIEEVLRSGRPAIVTVNGRPQVAVTPLIGAVEAAEEHLLRSAPAHIQSAIRRGEADLISGNVSLEESAFTNLGVEVPEISPEELELPELPDAARVHDAIRSAAGRPDAVAEVRRVLSEVDVFTLGTPAGETQVPGISTESDLLHFTIDDSEGQERVMLPVFTTTQALRSALFRNSDWQSLYILQVSGKGLLENVETDVTIVIDPWSDLEFHVLPEPGRRTYATEPVLAAAQLVAAGG